MVDLAGLSVSVSAQVADFRAGINRAKESAQDLSLSLFKLSRASESAESNMDEVGRSAVGASGGMTSLAITSEGAGFSVRGLSGSIILSLVPALATLTAALAPVVAALGGFVAIAGAIGALGIVGTLGAIATNTELLKTEALKTLEVFKEQFAPVFDLMATAIVVLLEEFREIIPQMVPAREIINQLTINFLNLGRAFIDILPAMVQLATTLAAKFLPPFVQFVNTLLPKVPGMIMGMVRAFREVNPIFMAFGQFLGRFIPELMQFGMVALPVVADAFGLLGGATMGALEAVNALDLGSQKLIAQLSLITPVLLGLVSLLGGPVTAAIVGFTAAYTTNFLGIRNITNRVVGRVIGFLGKLETGARRVFKGIQGYIQANENDFTALQLAVENAVRGYKNVLTQVLLPVSRNVFRNFLMPLIRDVARLYARHFDDIVRETAETITAITGFLRRFGQWFNTFWNKHGNTITTIVRGAWSAVKVIVLTTLDAMLTGVRVVLNLLQGDWKEAWQAIQGFAQRTISRIVTHLRGPAKNALKAAMGVVIGALEAVWEGFVDWLIGNSLIPDMINDIKTYLANTGKALIQSGINTLIGGAEDAFDWLTGTGEGTLLNDIKSGLSDIASFFKNAGKKALKSAADVMVGAVESVFQAISFDIEWPEVPEIVKKAFNGNLNIDWPEPPDSITNNSTSGAITLSQEKNKNNTADRNQITIESLIASGRAEGREAAQALQNELRQNGF